MILCTSGYKDMSNLFWLNDDQWQKIEPYPPRDVHGIERVDDRRIISGIVHILRNGSRWCDCPKEYGLQKPSTTALCGGHSAAPKPSFPINATEYSRSRSIKPSIKPEIKSNIPSTGSRTSAGYSLAMTGWQGIFLRPSVWS